MRKIERGEIGRPRMILARRCHPRSVVRGREWLNDDETGGVLNYAGTHNIDLICWYMGCAPERGYAEMGQLILEDRKFTDCAVVTFKFPEGAIAVLYETFAYPEAYPHRVDRSLEILGDRGVLRIDFMNQPLRRFADTGIEMIDSVTWPDEGNGLGGALLSEIEHFIECIAEKKRPLVTGEEGRRSIQIANAARKAAASGQAVTVGK